MTYNDIIEQYKDVEFRLLQTWFSRDETIMLFGAINGTCGVYIANAWLPDTGAWHYDVSKTYALSEMDGFIRFIDIEKNVAYDIAESADELNLRRKIIQAFKEYNEETGQNIKLNMKKLNYGEHLSDKQST